MPVPLSRRALAGAAVAAAALGGYVAVDELLSSQIQARVFTRMAQQAKFWTEPGQSPSIRFTRTGPYDHRLGYAELPEFLRRLQARNFVITEQARVSPTFASTLDWGLFAPYREKTQAGLTVLDCGDEPLFAARHPERTYPTFETIPHVLVETLLFVENRELLGDAHPKHNPAVEWSRFAKALVDQAIHVVYPPHPTPGGSTLATQIEKYRHSPEGRTSSAGEKLRQMASASLRAYLDGEETFAARHRIVLDYINTVPLAARPGHGEVHGLADGLWIWFGRDFREINALLDDYGSAPLGARALAYRQALALMLSQRRPTYYLMERPDELEAQSASYLRLLADAGIITREFRDAALAQPLDLELDAPAQTTAAFSTRKAAHAVRANLAGMLGLPLLYDLDRLDLTVATTLEGRLQRSVTAALAGLHDPRQAKAAGLIGPRMLDRGDPAGVTYSFTLYERTPTANIVLVQADSLEQPLDINENTKLDLGSTAKLRTLVTYLEMVGEMHKRYGELPPEQLKRVPAAPQDAIARWALAYLATARNRELGPMLEAALERRYSASPYESFFTGGGLHTFENFDDKDNARVLSVREGLRRSVNLVFVRLMRDMARHAMFNMPGSGPSVLEDAADPARHAYLVRFADREGSEFVRQFHARYQGKPPRDALELLAGQLRRSPARLAALHRSVAPEAGLDEFTAFLHLHLPNSQRPKPETAARLYRDYAPGRLSLADRGYVAGVHPLELAVMRVLQANPGATQAQTLEATRDERLAAYAWLFKPKKKAAQDARIRVLLEADAFAEIHRRWKRLGYPFDSLVPSYATALGVSADRPAALAELMGILVNGGVRLPTVRIRSMHFATGTPYETRMEHRSGTGERVLAPEVAATAREVLVEVVEDGTARRLRGVFRNADGTPLEVGGKTGTGDHRYQTFGKGGQVLSSRVVGRAGTFVFHLGDRYFGTVTAHVRGPAAADYRFTSGMPVQILKTLAPAISAATRGGESPRGAHCVRPMPRSVVATLE